jgi:tetratricopeptide (TPR) repeat protein
MFSDTILNFLALVYVVVGVFTVIRAWRERRTLTDDVLTPHDRFLLGQLAFFVLVPPGVLLHELAHAAATVQVGGEVAGFHYAFFYGYVVPVGNFTLLQEWWIALSGNLVSILYGLAGIPLIFVARTKWVKYLLLAFVRVQLAWALIGYPLLTLAGFGDWRTIYAPEMWAWAVPFAIFHIALIAVLYFVNRSARVRLWEASLFPETDPRLTASRQTFEKAPASSAERMERGSMLAEADMPDLAKADFQAVLKSNPRDAMALHSLAQIEYEERDIPAARRHFQESLNAGGSNSLIQAKNHYYLGLILAEQGKFQGAVEEYNHAIRLDPNRSNYYYWRGMAWRALRDKNRAGTDFLKAAELSEPFQPEVAAQARAMAFEEG